MKIIFKHSFAWRVCLYIVPVIIVIFCIIMVWFYNISKDKIITASLHQADVTLAKMSLKIEEQLQSVSNVSDYTSWLVVKNMDNPEKVREIMRNNMQNNPLIIGCGVAYAPKIINGKEKLNMIYASKKSDGIDFKIIGSEHYYYPGMDWYVIPTQLRQSYWSEPYFDEGAGDIIMATYSVPLINSKGEVCGLLGVDISLLGFTDMVEKTKPYPDSYTFLLSRNGYYLTHKNKEKIMHETIFSNAYENKNKDYEEIGKSMIAGDSGSKRFHKDGKALYAIYAPIQSNGWSICNVCSEKDVLAGLNGVTRSIAIIFIVGILCFTFFSIFIIKRLMKPLEGFASSAEDIARGNFNANLPVIKSEDEMKELRDSFVYMQKSLTTYMAELKETTASKQRIESELVIAHNIQMGMIPKIFPPFPERADVDLFAILKPAKEVGGDLYDFFIMDEKLYFTIGDVSGKGVPAALFMAVTRSLFRNISNYAPTPKDIVISMNDTIADQNESNMFVTLFVGILDLQTGKLIYCNAGHNPPVLIKQDGEVMFMKSDNVQPVAGVFANYEYTNEEVVLESGTKLFCYTDGVVEAESEEKELYSEERLLNTLHVHHEFGVKRITEQVVNSVSEHVLSAAQSDDLTILVINYKK